MSRLTESIGDVFARRLFRIPDYQRGYAWGEKQWNDLLQDLELLSPGRDHFTGTLVIRSAGDGQKSFRDEEGIVHNIFDVIDGQQRLTTVVLLLKAVYNQMCQIEGRQKLANGIREQYLAVRNLNQQWCTKLQLNRDSQDFFVHSILAEIMGRHKGIEGPTIHSHARMQEALTHFQGYLHDIRVQQAEAFGDWLDDFHYKITNSLNLIVYTVDSDTDAGVIFETMNDRGKPLTELEKVKNYLLYIASKLDLQAEHDLQNQINTTWAHILEHLMEAKLHGEEHEDQLLRMHWLMAYDPQPKNWQQSRSIKDRFSLKIYHGKHAALLQEVQIYLSSLRDAATAYCDIHKPRHPGAFNNIPVGRVRDAIIRSSEKLARLGPRATFMPLLMAIRLHANDNGETYRAAVDLCERYNFRLYVWMGYKATTGQSRLFRMAYNFYRNPQSDTMLLQLKQTILAYCTDEQFAERFRNQTVNWYYWGGLQYFLYEYEEYFAETQREPIQYSWESLWVKKGYTIEHILPQTPTDSYWFDRFNEQQRKRWTHDIGNLTLTYDNSCLGNRPFPIKRGTPDKDCCYASSKFFIEHQLAQVDDWTVEEIEKRRNAIVQWTLQRWHIELPSAEHLPTSTAPTTAEEHFLQRADRNGTGEELRAIIAAARKHSIYPRMQRTWHGIQFTPLQKRNAQLFWLGPDLWWGTVYPEIFEQYYGIPGSRVQELLDFPYGKHLTLDEAEELVERLDHLFTSSTEK